MIEKKQPPESSSDHDWWSLTRKSSILLTENLILRNLQPSDAKVMARLANNYDVVSMTVRLPHPYSDEDAQAFIATAGLPETSGCTFAITLAKSGEFIGCCGLRPTNRDVGSAIGYWLGEPYWGAGYATEAAHALVDLAFKTTSHERVHGSCRVVNPASRRVLEKCGFQHTGNGMIHSASVGNTVPVDYYVLDRNTWISLKSWGDSQ